MATVTFPTFPSVDFSKLDLSQVKMPQINMPQFRAPQFSSPELKIPQVNTEAVTNAVKDAGYIAVGFAVLAVQKAQVRRQELRKSLTDQVGSSKSQLASIVDAVEAGLATLDARLVAVEAKVDDALESVEKRLPGTAGAALEKAHEAVKVVRNQARTMLTPE